ncbi:MAG: hypothetical protein R6V32_11970 [Bacteroidales bacterium]
MKNQFLYLIFTIFLLTSAISLNAQEEKEEKREKEERYKHAVGGAFGKTSGKGIAYRHTIDKFSAQLAFLPEVEDFKHDFEYTTGLTFFYELFHSEHVNLFVYQSNQYHCFVEKGYYPPYPMPEPVRIPGETYHHYNMGLGFGFEIVMFKRLSLNLMIGYSAQENFKKYVISPELGVFYNF